MDIQHLRDRGLILFECISGSRSYGLDLPGSDTDHRGVFIQPKVEYYGLTYVEQVSNESQDQVFYELGRFFELLARGNPNILELLAVPEECILQKHPLMEAVRPELFLSRLCQQTFARYALSQIQKARGLNKKINRPVEGERRNILDFCYIARGSGSVPLLQWLGENGLKQEQCGLTAMPHMRDVYALYIDKEQALGYRGIMAKEYSNEVTLSSIPKGEVPAAYLYFNKDSYSIYCKEYKAYQEWVEKRNELRYRGTLEHGKSYDAKNMMHVFRLLDMAEEIALGKGVITKRPNREFLLKIRSGAFGYDELLERAEAKMQRIQELYEQSSLPETPDMEKVEHLLVQMREAFYNC
jgi:uncharacterized protein